MQHSTCMAMAYRTLPNSKLLLLVVVVVDGGVANGMPADQNLNVLRLFFCIFRSWTDETMMQ